MCRRWVHSDGGGRIEVVVNMFGSVTSSSWCWDGGGRSWSSWFPFRTPGRWAVFVIIGGVVVSSWSFVAVVVVVGGRGHGCW